VTGGKDRGIVACDAPAACPVGTVCLPGAQMPCIEMAQIHAEKLRLCDDLETIADGLPSSVDRLKCLRIAGALVPLLRVSHAYEEEHVFPAFRGKETADSARTVTIGRLKTEHIEDECAAQDLTDILFAVGHGAPIDNPEALGFMLRAFFETLRRHIAFEREHVLPALAQNLPG